MKHNLLSLALLAALSLAVKPEAGTRKTAEVHKGYWYYYDLDTTGEVITGESKIAFDSKGNLKIAYREHYSVKFGTFQGNGFDKQSKGLDSGTGSGARIAMDLDPEGNPHIIYHDWSYQQLFYGQWDGAKWKNYLLDTNLMHNKTDFYQLSLNVDSKGRSHIAYTAGLGDSAGGPGYPGIHYGLVDSMGKALQVHVAIDPNAGLSGKWNDVTTDDKDQPVVPYYLFDGANLAIAYLDGGTWKRQVIDSTQFLDSKGFFPSIKRDTAGYFYLAYQNHSTRKLMLAHGKLGETWSQEVVDTLTGWDIFGTQSVLAMDNDGSPYLAYTEAEVVGDNPTKSKLKLAHKTGGNWVTEVVDSNGIAGLLADLAISPEGYVAISYYELVQKHLRLVIAKKDEPLDEDNNGVLDYREAKPISIRGGKRTLDRAHPGKRKAYNLSGKRVKTQLSRFPEGSAPTGIILAD